MDFLPIDSSCLALLLAGHFLTFTRPDDVNRAAQDKLGVKVSDVCGLPTLTTDWTLEAPNFDGQRVVQREDTEDWILEN